GTESRRSAAATFWRGRTRRVSVRSRIDVTLAGLRPRRQWPISDLDLRRPICVLHLVPPNGQSPSRGYLARTVPGWTRQSRRVREPPRKRTNSHGNGGKRGWRGPTGGAER